MRCDTLAARHNGNRTARHTQGNDEFAIALLLVTRQGQDARQIVHVLLAIVAGTVLFLSPQTKEA